MKKSNRIILFASIIVIIALCLFYFINQYRTKTITDFYNNDANKINKIDILNGSNGNIVTVTDKKMIANICDYLTNSKFKKIPDPKSDGWTYGLAVYEGDKEVFGATFMGDNRCGTGKSYYNIEKSTTVTLESLYNTAKDVKK